MTMHGQNHIKHSSVVSWYASRKYKILKLDMKL